ncbi:MAG: hypothetical protein ACE5GE_07800 [Phycisphaerae bacterium]
MNSPKAFSASWTVVAAMLAWPVSLYGGVWGDPGTSTVDLKADAMWTDFSTCGLPVGGPCFSEVGTDTVLATVAGYKGWDFGNGAVVQLSNDGCPCPTLYAGAGAHARADGVGTSLLKVRWKVVAEPYNSSQFRDDYNAWGKAHLAATIEADIITVPPGEPVTVFYSWWGLVFTLFDPEAGLEDPVEIKNVSLKLNGVDLIKPGSVDFANISAFFVFPLPGDSGMGSFPAFGGDTISITMTGDADAFISDPGQGFLEEDQADALFRGEMVLSINEPLPANPFSSGAPSRVPEFSLDIGSDTELSDPFGDLDEVFDPGDTYPWAGLPLPVGGADGVRDDALIFGFDYVPDPPDGPPAISAAPTCSGFPPSMILADSFDLDGTDALDLSLSSSIDPDFALPGPITGFASSCVHEAESLVISFDDDSASHYADASCSVPAADASPAGDRYGTSLERDEIWLLDLNIASPALPGVPPAGVGVLAPVSDEVSLHLSMGPNPDASEAEDDDVDALDMDNLLDPGACGVWYFSPDHEATGLDPLTGFMGPLDPGGIYEVDPFGGGPIMVVNEDVHLGVPEETDIDAFEFVRLEFCVTGGICDTGLALLFSVDEDDPTVAGDESGGLDPNMIYASFLDGAYFELLNAALADDVDALAASDVPFAPLPCVTTGTVNWAETFEAYPTLIGIAGTGGWTTWLGDPAVDAFVSDVVSNSGTQSLEIVTTNDVVHEFSIGGAGSPTGQWSIEAQAYVPFGATGLGDFILMNEYSPAGGMPPSAWSVDVVLDADAGLAYDSFGGGAVPLLYGIWAEIRVDIDFGLDEVSIYYDGSLIDKRSWTAGTGLGIGLPDLAVVDLYSGTISVMYYDDLSLTGNPDCNTNGVSDLCDIVSGTASDLNGNSVPDSCEPSCGVLAARSCQQHTEGRLCLDLDVPAGSGGSNVEPRLGQPNDIEIDLDVSPAGVAVASVDCTDNSGVTTSHLADVATTTLAGSTVTVTFAPALPDQQACVITLDCGASVCVQGLRGDVDRNGAVTTGDASQVRFFFNQPANGPGGPQWDLDQVNGVTTGDFSQIRFFFNSTVPACP